VSTPETSWETLWNQADLRAEWQEPAEEVRDLLLFLQPQQRRRVLDIGCGVGRHLLLFARAGFETYGIEPTDSGLSHCRAALQRSGVTAHLLKGEMHDLSSFEAGFFDVVVCWHVIYHAYLATIVTTLREIHRVLRPSGFLVITFNSTKNRHFGEGTEVEPHTFVGAHNKIDGDLPHHFSTREEVLGLLESFRVISIEEREDTYAGQVAPQTYHWRVIAQKQESLLDRFSNKEVSNEV